jgi:hypothetical protein
VHGARETREERVREKEKKGKREKRNEGRQKNALLTLRIG